MYSFLSGKRIVREYVRGSVLWCLGTGQSGLHFTPGRPVHSNAISTSLVSRAAITARIRNVHRTIRQGKPKPSWNEPSVGVGRTLYGPNHPSAWPKLLSRTIRQLGPRPSCAEPSFAVGRTRRGLNHPSSWDETTGPKHPSAWAEQSSAEPSGSNCLLISIAPYLYNNILWCCTVQ